MNVYASPPALLHGVQVVGAFTRWAAHMTPWASNPLVASEAVKDQVALVPPFTIPPWPSTVLVGPLTVGAVLSMVTVRGADVVAFPDVSTARAATWAEPSGNAAVSRTAEYGGVVSVATTDPRTRKSTRTTAALSEASAARLTWCET